MAIGPYTDTEAIAAIEGDKKSNPKNYPTDPKAASHRREVMKKRLATRYK